MLHFFAVWSLNSDVGVYLLYSVFLFSYIHPKSTIIKRRRPRAFARHGLRLIVHAAVAAEPFLFDYITVLVLCQVKFASFFEKVLFFKNALKYQTGEYMRHSQMPHPAQRRLLRRCARHKRKARGTRMPLHGGQAARASLALAYTAT